MVFELIDDVDQDDYFELILIIASVLVTVTSSIILAIQSFSKFTMLRLACLLANTSVCILSIFNLLHRTGALPRLKGYWFFVSAVTTIYTTTLVVFILNMGRRFYQKELWNTPIFKITIGFVIIFDILNITITIVAFTQYPPSALYRVFLVQMMWGMITTMSAFVYTFVPVLSLHVKSWRVNPPDAKTVKINPQNAAVGTWYMTALVVLSVPYLTLYAVCISWDQGQHLLLTNAIDSILRSGLALALALPPPRWFIERMKATIMHRHPVVLSLNDRGVVSTGIIDMSDMS